MIRFPGPGCVVEFIQGNRAQQAIVLEEQSGTLRLYTLSRREVRMPASRILPWFGPSNPLPESKQDLHSALEATRLRREALSAEIDPVYLWNIAHEEITHASARWFAELLWQEPDLDQVAACGHALLECKTHFKFNPPDFDVLSEEKAAVRLHEAERTEKRNAVLAAGRTLFPLLFEAHQKNQIPAKALLPELEPELENQLETLPHTRLANPDEHETSLLWREFSKNLPDNPHIPLFLLEAWGKVPPHYNFSLDRIGYQPGKDWFKEFEAQIEEILHSARGEGTEFIDLPFISVDTPETEDLDDAFHLEKDADANYILQLAIACPAVAWPWGSELDKTVLRRASSLYLPEGSLHMMPEPLGVDGMSLAAGKERQAMLARFKISPEGEICEFDVSLKRITVQANLFYEDCEAFIDCEFVEKEAANAKPNPAAPYAGMLNQAYELAQVMQAKRIEQGAVIIKRPEPLLILHHNPEQGKDPVRVELLNPPAADKTQVMIGEFMVLLNATIAQKAEEWALPLIYRTQHVALPKEYAGIWEAPEDIARVVKSLPPASIDQFPRPHAGLGIPAYATVSSPLRRYTDLFNQGQVLSHLQSGVPLFSQGELSGMLPLIAARSDAASSVQKQRPRYWKLVYFKQQGDKRWYEAVISDENDVFAIVSLQNEAIQLRAKRAIFGEKAMPGQLCRVRIGKVHPLNNEIQLMAVEEY